MKVQVVVDLAPGRENDRQVAARSIRPVEQERCEGIGECAPCIGRVRGLSLFELEPSTRAWSDEGSRILAADYLLAVQDLQAFGRTVARFFREVDVWLTPTLGEPPLRHGEDHSGRAFTAFPAWVANATGNPAMSVPLAWNPDGLPIGVHALARFGDEATLLRLASQLEEARPWSGRTPAIFARSSDRMREPVG